MLIVLIGKVLGKVGSFFYKMVRKGVIEVEGFFWDVLLLYLLFYYGEEKF